MVDISICKTEKAEYPTESPFHPSEKFPEYPFEDISDSANYVYKTVRDLFIQLEFDKENIGKENWNPLKWLVEPGMNVVIKPNFVLSRHSKGKEPFAIVTNPSVMRAIADYCWIALEGKGKIIIADAPQYNCNWEELMELTKLEKVKDFYDSHRNNSFELRDLRNYWSRGKHFPSMKEEISGDPRGTLKVNLKEESAIKNISDPKKIYGAVYHRQETIENHTGKNQWYSLAKTIMEADVLISVPKLKVHKKVGVTMNVKGLVGINTNKNLIVHYSLGSPKEGGDQYPDNHFTPIEEKLIKTERWMYDTFLAKQSVPLEYIHRSIYWLHGKFIKPLGIGVEKKKRLLDAGNWYGNDSAWRMSVDLLKILYFTDKLGNLQKNRQRRLFTVIDGVIGGENEGPLDPDPNYSGVLLASENLLAADIVATRLMGFDPNKIKMYTYLLGEKNWDYGFKKYSDIRIKTNIEEWKNLLENITDKFLDYKPYPGWIGKIEINKK